MLTSIVRLFSNRALAAMLVQNFFIGIVFYSLLYYLPIYYQSAREMSILSSAALILPLVIAQSIASVLSGQYISRVGRYGEVLWTGYICWTLGSGLHLLFTKDFSVIGIVFILAIEGFGVGLVFQPS
jgi:MFS family permease